MDHDIIGISFNCDGGREGIDDDPQTPLARAARALLRDGKPIQAISLCFFSKTADLEATKDFRWLGVFVLSEGGRIVFFPGFSVTSHLISSYRGLKPLPHRLWKIDHLSIESDLKSIESDLKAWHFTNRSLRKHHSGGKTIPLGDDRHLAVGMSIRDENTLLPVSGVTKMSFQSHPNDTSRKLNEFLALPQNSWPWVSLPDSPQPNTDITLPHFGIIVGPNGFPKYRGGLLNIPQGSLHLAKPFTHDDLSMLPVRSHRFSLGDYDVEIISARLPGELTAPTCFTSLG